MAPYASNMMSWGGDNMRWCGVSKKSSTGGDAYYDLNAGPLSRYLGGNGRGMINRCESFPTPEGKPSYEGNCGGYGINTLIGKQGPDEYSDWAFAAGYWLHRVDDPGKTIMFADSATPVSSSGNWSTPGGMSHFGYSTSVEAPGAGMSPTMHFRHNRRSNTGFCDGHVEPMAMHDGPSDFMSIEIAFPCKDDTKGQYEYFHPEK